MTYEWVEADDALNRRVFFHALSVSYLVSELHLSAHNSWANGHAIPFKEEVAELRVDQAWGGDRIDLVTNTWFRVTYVREHEWKYCAVLRLDPSEDDRPVGPDVPPVEIPRGASLLSAEKLHDLFISFRDSVQHHNHSSDRVVLLVPVKNKDEWVPAVLEEARLSEKGWGTRLFLDAILVRDLGWLNESVDW